MKIPFGFGLAGRRFHLIALGLGIVVGACSGEVGDRTPASASQERVSRDPSKRALPPAPPPDSGAATVDASALVEPTDGDAGTPVVVDAEPGAVSAACETTADCTTWSSYCLDAPCTCVPIARSGGSPVCTGRTVSCIAEPCTSRMPVCVDGTCTLAPQ